MIRKNILAIKREKKCESETSRDLGTVHTGDPTNEPLKKKRRENSSS